MNKKIQLTVHLDNGTILTSDANSGDEQEMAKLVSIIKNVKDLENLSITVNKLPHYINTSKITYIVVDEVKQTPFVESDWDDKYPWK